ncbi:MAG TPA: chemotaxis protein CheW [Gemmatimonadaceae bacterium]
MFRDGAARLLVFRIGAERFGIALETVDEVIDAPAVQSIPDAPATVLGVATIRGELITVYDPRPLLRVEGTLDGAALLFGREDRRFGLAIDDVYDAIRIEEGDVLKAPGGGADASDGVLVGLIRRDGELIGILDANALLDAAIAGEGEKK